MKEYKDNSILKLFGDIGFFMMFFSVMVKIWSQF